MKIDHQQHHLEYHDHDHVVVVALVAEQQVQWFFLKWRAANYHVVVQAVD